MKFYRYTIDPSFVKEGRIQWKLTGNGVFAVGTSGGVPYFIKKRIHERFPTRDLPKEVYEQGMRNAKALQERQKVLQKKMKSLSVDKDHIVIEEEHFWDKDSRQFVTVTRFLEGILPNDYDFKSLPLDSFLQLAADAALLLKKLHASHVIHSDLKPQNIAVLENGKAYDPYLIDFDSSFPTDRIPEWDAIGGTDLYLSPEVFGGKNGLPDSAAATVTPAVDIFSLGIVFHYWWTGFFPCYDDGYECLGHAVLDDGAVTIHEKFNQYIGANQKATLMSLLNWMFAKNPAERPTSETVYEVLNDRLPVPAAYHKGKDEKQIEAELWPVHLRVADLADSKTLEAKGVRVFKRVNEGCGSGGLKYRVVCDSCERILTIEELCAEGYATRREVELEQPWPEHPIVYADPDVIARKGYCRIVRSRMRYQKCYTLTRTGGMQFSKEYQWLIREGLAILQTHDVVADTPWPEHGTQYDPDAMRKLKVQSIARIDIGGEHRYRIVYGNDGGSTVRDGVSVNNLKLMGLIK